jgi:polar amino acid transport system ATP-binding protein
LLEEGYPSSRHPKEQLMITVQINTLAMSPDPQLVGEVLDTMRMLSKEGMTMIVVTHEMRFAREVSDRVAFFREGRIHEIGSPEQIFENARKPETAAFLKSI